jgi:ankyrin repeat protein
MNMSNWQEKIFQLQNKTLDIDTKDEQGYPLLHKAVNEGNIDICRTLIDLGTDVNTEDECNSVLLVATSNNNLEIVKLLIDSGADVNLKPEDGYGYTILHEALTVNASFEIVKLLIDNNADVRAKTDEDCTIIAFAAGHPDYKVFQLLMNTEAIIDINLPDNDGYTPFLKAVWHGYLETAQLIFDRDININAICEKMNFNALQVAVRYWGTLETVKWLLDIGFDIKIKDNEGYTLLHYCMGNSQEKLAIAKFLLENGLDVNAECTTEKKSAKGFRTPLQIAMSNNYYQMVSLLKEYGAIE